MHELIGDDTEAEVLLRTGKEISRSQGLPICSVVFYISVRYVHLLKIYLLLHCLFCSFVHSLLCFR
jgi:hypothetical protein